MTTVAPYCFAAAEVVDLGGITIHQGNPFGLVRGITPNPSSKPASMTAFIGFSRLAHSRLATGLGAAIGCENQPQRCKLPCDVRDSESAGHDHRLGQNRCSLDGVELAKRNPVLGVWDQWNRKHV